MRRLRRAAGVVILGTLLWVALNLWAVFRSSSYWIDCYEVAHWNGKTFDFTGEYKCIGGVRK